MEKFHTTIDLISKNVWLSLPVTIEMLFATLTTILGGSLTDKYGWRRPFYVGLLLGSIGLIVVFLLPGPWFYLLSRSLSGSGFGLLLISLQSSVVQEMPENKAKGIANIFAGVFAGSLCGSVTGAMLAEHWAFSTVFLFAGLLLFIGAIYLYILFNFSDTIVRKSSEKLNISSSPSTDSTWKSLLTNLHATGLIFFIAIPSAMCLVGVLYYLTPLYLKQLGFQQGNIGRVIMVYGLCIIYIGPLISTIIDRKKNKLFFVILAGVLSVLSIAPFVLWKGISSVILAVFILGIASSATSACFVVYYLDITKKYKISEQKRVSVFRTLQRIGQVAGSFIFANMITSFGFHHGLRYLLLLLFITILIFMLIISTMKQKYV